MLRRLLLLAILQVTKSEITYKISWWREGASKIVIWPRFTASKYILICVFIYKSILIVVLIILNVYAGDIGNYLSYVPRKIVYLCFARCTRHCSMLWSPLWMGKLYYFLYTNLTLELNSFYSCLILTYTCRAMEEYNAWRRNLIGRKPNFHYPRVSIVIVSFDIILIVCISVTLINENYLQWRKQTDSHSCGYYVMRYMLHIVSDGLPQWFMKNKVLA